MHPNNILAHLQNVSAHPTTFWWYMGDDITAFPTEIFDATYLETLIIHSFHLPSIPKGISKLKNLKGLFIVGLDNPKNILTALPPDFFDLPHLQELCLKNLNLSEMPDTIGNLTQLTSLKLEGLPLRELPESMGNFRQLTELKCTALPNLNKLPSALGNLRNLEKIEIVQLPIKYLPAFSNLPKIKEIKINNTPITALPDAFAVSPVLSKLDVSYNKIEKFPPLYDLPNLESFYANGNPSKEAYVEVLWCEKLRGCNCTLPKEMDDMEMSLSNFVSTLNKYKIQRSSRLSLLYLVSAYKEKIPVIPQVDLLEALLCNDEDFYKPALQEIARRYAAQPRKLSQGCELVAQGDVSFKKAELAQRLEPLGVKYSTKITKNTTHLVVAKKINKTAGWDNPNLVLMTDKDVNQFLKENENQYLVQSPVTETRELNQNVAQMLLSPNEETIQLALQMLDGGGVAKEIITELFLVFKNPQIDSKIRKKAHQLLLLNASPALQERLNFPAQLFNSRVFDDKLKQNIDKYALGTELNFRTVAQHIYNTINIGLPVLFPFLSKEERIELMQQELQKNNYSTDLFFLWLDYANPKKNNDLSVLVPKVKTLTLGGVHLRLLDPLTFSFVNVQSINLRFCQLKKLPEQIKNLQYLQELNISYNQLKEFPKVLLEMLQLKRIHISGNPFALNPNLLPPKEIYELTEDYVLLRKD